MSGTYDWDLIIDEYFGMTPLEAAMKAATSASDNPMVIGYMVDSLVPYYADVAVAWRAEFGE